MRVSSVCVCFLFLIFFNEAAFACKIPVFRYALEKWFADPYTVVVLYQESLSADEKKALETLRAEEVVENTNIRLVVSKVAPHSSIKAVRELTKVFEGGKHGAQVFLLNPSFGGRRSVAWQQSLNQLNIEKMIYSPLREKLCKCLLNGDSVVWLLVESGNVEADKKAFRALAQAAEKVRAKLKLPAGVVKTDGTMTGKDAIYDPENELISEIPLRVSFSILRLGMNDEVLRAQLDSQFPLEKGQEGKPRVFSIFGRGRVLAPMIGEMISEKNLGLISEYVFGSCSCEVKAQNPGVDLFLFKDWDKAIRHPKAGQPLPSWVKKGGGE